MRRFLRWLEDLLSPRGVKCLCCDARSDGNLLCPTCLEGLKAMRLSPAQAGDDYSRSVYRYDGVAKKLVAQLKYELLADAAAVLAADMAAAIQDMRLPPDTVLTWVTMPELRRRQRGIDHGRELCDAVSRLSGLPARQLLIREGRVHTQRGLNREARLRNLSGTLVCKEAIRFPVLLIDDVTTTGATASACAEALTIAGATRVFVLTATRAMLQQKSTGKA